MTVREYRQKQAGDKGPGLIRQVRGLLSQKSIGLDLGTHTTRLCLPEDGVVLSEPSAVAVNRQTGEVTRYGTAAVRLLGRTSAQEEAIRPIQKGAIVDYARTLALIQSFIRESCGSMLRPPKLLISVPASLNDAEKRYVIMAAEEAGAGGVYLMESVRAAALGADLDIKAPFGRLVVDIGAEVTDVAVLSLGGIVVSGTLDLAGKAFDEAVMGYVRTKYGALIGELRAEEVKIRIGSVREGNRPEEMKRLNVNGRNVATGLPVTVVLSPAELKSALIAPAEAIGRQILRVIEKTPPELLPNLHRGGITLTGGGSQLDGLAGRLSRITGLGVTVAEHPEDCTAEGLLRTLPHLDDMVEGMLVSDVVHRRTGRYNN